MKPGIPDLHNSLELFSVASTNYVVSIYSEVQSALESCGVHVKHTGLATDLWYGGNAYPAYEKSSVDPVNVDRQKGAVSIWWHDSSIMTELENNLAKIQQQVLGLMQQHRHPVLLIADDQGPLEIFLMQVFRDCGVPIILFEHGYGFAASQFHKSASPPAGVVSTITTQISRILAIPTKLARAINSLFTVQSSKAKYVLPKIHPFGQNGSDVMCCLSEWTRDVHFRSGSATQKMIVTGNPYWDKLVRAGYARTKLTSHHRPIRVLIVSTGHGKFGAYSRFKEFMDAVEVLCKALFPEVEVSLRLKHGEDKALLEQHHYTQMLRNLHVKLDDNRIPFDEALSEYDLTICDLQSLAVLESILSGVPVLTVKYTTEEKQGALTWLAQVYQEQIGVISLTDLRQARQIVVEALNSSYADSLHDNLIRNTGHTLGAFDGMAGARVAQEILELM
jgi:hypothetical protein